MTTDFRLKHGDCIKLFISIKVIMATPKPRVIALSKRDGQTYGFFLRIEEGVEGHLVRALEMGGPAELAGLKDGDRIIRVNGTFVDNLEHSQVQIRF